MIHKNEKFGQLTVLNYKYSKKTGSVYRRHYECICSCGNTKIIRQDMLVSGRTKSCGCLVKLNNYKHGLTKTIEYRTWASMIQRCCNENDTAYKNYGGRGIKVCNKWRNSFEEFLKDMGKKPSGTSIDRIDNNGNYCPENCRWATIAEQSYNQRHKNQYTKE